MCSMCWTGWYLGELVEAEDLFAVVVAMATLIHQSLELDGDLVVREGEHHEGQQAAEGGSWRRWRGRREIFSRCSISSFTVSSSCQMFLISYLK